MPSPLPEHDDAFWESLAQRNWTRTRWKKSDDSQDMEKCYVYGTPIHRKGTYYRRPAYTDGDVWICQQAYDEMILRTTGERASRARPHPDD